MDQSQMTPEQMAAMAKQQCIFCQIASGKVASKKVYEDEHVLAVLDINPANPGHVLLMTKEHYVVMPQIPDDIVAYIGMVTKGLSHALLRALKAQGTTIFVANGVTAGQRAQHFMLHIIPRMEKDGVEINYPEHQISDEDYKKIHTALRQGIAKTLGQVEGLEEETAAEEEMIEEAEEKIAEKEEEKKEAEVDAELEEADEEDSTEEQDEEESAEEVEEAKEASEEEADEETEEKVEEAESLESMATEPKKKKKKAKKKTKKKKEKLEPDVPNSRNKVSREPDAELEEVDEEKQKLDDVSSFLMG